MCRAKANCGSTKMFRIYCARFSDNPDVKTEKKAVQALENIVGGSHLTPTIRRLDSRCGEDRFAIMEFINPSLPSQQLFHLARNQKQRPEAT